MLLGARDENEALSVSDGSSKLDLIRGEHISYARGQPYTVIHPETMHAAAAAEDEVEEELSVG